MKINDLKGKVAIQMHNLVKDTIMSMVNDMFKNKFNTKTSRYPHIYTNKGLKQLFTKNGIRYNGYRERHNWDMDCYFTIPEETALQICPTIKERRESFRDTYKDIHKFIEYCANFDMCYCNNTNYGEQPYVMGHIRFDMRGILDAAEQMLGPIVKKTNQVFKDANGVQIKRGDEIIWVKYAGSSMLNQSIVDDFDEDAIITDGRKIKVDEYRNNSHIIVLNNKLNWCGMHIS